VTRSRSISGKTSAARTLVDSTARAPRRKNPWIPGQASGRLWAMGRTTSCASSGRTSIIAAAVFEL
jgi:hypothetical protein